MNKLELRKEEGDIYEEGIIITYIDGTSFDELTGDTLTAGFPVHDLDSWPNFLRQKQPMESVAISVCNCCQPSCHSIHAKVTLSDQSVTWSDFETFAGERVKAGPFIFDRREYDAEIAKFRDATHDA